MTSLFQFLLRARFSWIDIVIISILGTILRVGVVDHLYLGWR